MSEMDAMLEALQLVIETQANMLESLMECVRGQQILVNKFIKERKSSLSGGGSEYELYAQDGGGFECEPPPDWQRCLATHDTDAAGIPARNKRPWRCVRERAHLGPHEFRVGTLSTIFR